MLRHPLCKHCEFFIHCPLVPSRPSDTIIAKQGDFAKHRSIYSMGMPADAVCVVKAGSVRLVFSDALGDERVCRFVWPGDVFGLESLLPGTEYSLTAVAREDSQVCFLERASFEALLRRDERRLWEVLLLICKRDLEREVEKLELTSPHVRTRLQHALAQFRELPHMSGRSRPVNVMQWELAQFVGASQEAVSRGLKRLQARDAQQRLASSDRHR